MNQPAPNTEANRWLVYGAACIPFFFVNFATFISPGIGSRATFVPIFVGSIVILVALAIPVAVMPRPVPARDSARATPLAVTEPA
ncbi:MAG TPA: hypothetical protein VL899_09970 [Alphaproteobacteria bacterium]|jgi:hypothetical protein|nr:hypothetical protein [Alphaproteobacteria bacterium]